VTEVYGAAHYPTVKVPPIRIELGIMIGDPACAAIVAVVKALEKQGYGHARIDLN
jgi:hypothetical protein